MWGNVGGERILVNIFFFFLVVVENFVFWDFQGEWNSVEVVMFIVGER